MRNQRSCGCAKRPRYAPGLDANHPHAIRTRRAAGGGAARCRRAGCASEQLGVFGDEDLFVMKTLGEETEIAIDKRAADEAQQVEATMSMRC